MKRLDKIFFIIQVTLSRLNVGTSHLRMNCSPVRSMRKLYTSDLFSGFMWNGRRQWVGGSANVKRLTVHTFAEFIKLIAYEPRG